MDSLEVKEAKKTQSIKEQALEKLRKLEATIKGLQTKADALKEALDKEKVRAEKAEKIIASQPNQCWWDGKACGRYSFLGGFQDVGAQCYSCPRLDFDRIRFVFERIFANFKTSEIEMTREEASQIAKEEAWEEIKEILDDVMEELEEG